MTWGASSVSSVCSYQDESMSDWPPSDNSSQTSIAEEPSQDAPPAPQSQFQFQTLVDVAAAAIQTLDQPPTEEVGYGMAPASDYDPGFGEGRLQGDGTNSDEAMEEAMEESSGGATAPHGVDAWLRIVPHSVPQDTLPSRSTGTRLYSEDWEYCRRPPQTEDTGMNAVTYPTSPSATSIASRTNDHFSIGFDLGVDDVSSYASDSNMSSGSSDYDESNADRTALQQTATDYIHPVQQVTDFGASSHLFSNPFASSGGDGLQFRPANIIQETSGIRGEALTPLTTSFLYSMNSTKCPQN